MQDRLRTQELFEAMITSILSHRDYLSNLDGATGDGDHGINMAKGFKIVKNELEGKDSSFSEGFLNISMILKNRIGGSMGPLYGAIFQGFSEMSESKTQLTPTVFREMMQRGYYYLKKVTPATIGDKTLMDVYLPALNALEKTAEIQGQEDLNFMLVKAKEGLEYTKTIQAKYGRASRLQDQTIGHLDPGAASCFVILSVIASFIEKERETR